jgi:hypothetical protein
MGYGVVNIILGGAAQAPAVYEAGVNLLWVFFNYRCVCNLSSLSNLSNYLPWM